jgi:hypothetical protein
MVDRPQEVAEAARLARRAVALGRDDAVALSYGGFVLGYVVGDLDDGSAFVERALVLNSNLAAAWGFSGWMKVCFGEPDTAIKHAAIAMRLSPVDPRLFAWQGYTAHAHLCAGRYDDAAAWAESALRDQATWPPAMRLAAASHALPGGLQKPSTSSNGYANWIPRFDFPISGISCRHIAEQRTVPSMWMVCGRRDCRNEGCLHVH